MPGNTLGRRSYYAYTSDAGEGYSYLTDDDLATSVGATLDDTAAAFPRRFNPRGVYCRALVGGVVVNKFVVCPLTTTAAYSSNTSTEITIDGTVFNTTGRRGETMSFASNG